MKTRKATVILVIVALAAGLFATFGRSGPEAVEVPIWSLLAPRAHSGYRMVDPFVSWSPDSESLLLSTYGMKSNKARVYKWEVGAKRLQHIADGISPNYLDANTFIYLFPDSGKVFKRDMLTGTQERILPAPGTEDDWKTVKAVYYDPPTRRVHTRMVEYTRFEAPGTEEYDLQGKLIGSVHALTSENTPAISFDSDGKKCAAVVKAGNKYELKICDKEIDEGRTVAAGYIGAVAWSPSAPMVAYGNNADVLIVDPESGRTRVVGRFGPAKDEQQDGRYVARLKWSPNGRYLAAMVYVPYSKGEYPMIYVLDMSGVAREKR